MAFDDLTSRQSALIRKLLEVELSGNYEPEFYATAVFGRGWSIQLEGKEENDKQELDGFTEGDLVGLALKQYVTIVKTSSGLNISLAARAFEQYHLDDSTSRLRSSASSAAEPDIKDSSIDIFISHSAKDKSIAEALVNLLKGSLNISAGKIRCTSVDGYRLPLGATTDEQLRKEIYAAKVFLGLITPISLQSTYVLFELGARWGANLHLAPVLAAGSTTTILRGPLSSLNALSCDEPAQIHQLLKDTALKLDSQLDDPSSYQRHIDALIQESKSGKRAVEIPSARQTFESIFSQAETGEFQYLSKKLDRQVRVSVDVIERTGHFREPAGSDFFNSNFLALILAYMDEGYDSFDFGLFRRKVAKAFCPLDRVKQKNDTQEYGTLNLCENFTHELQKYGLVRQTRLEYDGGSLSFEFTEKVHRYRYWLELTGYAVKEISFDFLDHKERKR